MDNQYGKFARPIASRGFIHREHLTTRLKSPLTLIQAPAGCLLTESLAAILEQDGRQVVWLRFGWEDFDPATCLLSLVEAFQAISEKVGAATLEKMRRLPGPLQGWPGLFALLGDEIKECLPESVTLVLEDLQYPARSPQTLALICKHFLPALPVSVRVTLISQKELPRYALQKQPEIVHSKDLRLSVSAIKRLFLSSELTTEHECLWQAVRLVDGSPVGLVGLCMTGQLLGEAYLQDVLRHQTNQAGLFTQIARDWLDTLDEGEIRFTGTLLALGYNHPDINQFQTGRQALTPSPWAQPLEAGWVRHRSLWLNSIETALNASPAFRTGSIHQAAEYLCCSGCFIPGIGLFFASAAADRAAEYLAQNVDEMLSLGQWELLKAWLERLPETLLEGQPRLLHAAGEIKSAQGDLTGAARDYQRASERYLQQDDQVGHVTSFLALSTLAANQGEAGEAWSSAYRALQIAQSARLPRQESSAELQVGLLALQAGDIPNALPHLELALKLARIAGDAGLLKRVDELHALAMEQERLQQWRQQQHQRYLAAQQAERLHLERLQGALQAPLELDGQDWGNQGWLQAPLNLKLGAVLSTYGHMQNGRESLTSKIKAWLRGTLANGHYREEDEFAIDGTKFIREGLNAHLAPAVEEQPTSPSIETGLLPQPIDQYFETHASLQQAEKPPPQSASIPQPDQPNKLELPSPESKSGPFLNIYCLGPFRVYLDDQLISNWPSGKGKAIFKFMIANLARSIPKEILMDTFWSEADSEAARQNMYVAIYGLRQAFRALQPDFSPIDFQEDHYLLNPEMAVWVDIEEFTHRYKAGLRLERKGMLAEAMKEYELAENLYQGDFLEEDLYEDWLIPRREGLKDSYLAILDRLSRYNLEENRYTTCIQLCQKILSKDECREDAHRRLMRCYYRQGQRHLALRQYHLCVESLTQVLDVSPMQETVALYHLIRDGKAV